MPRFRLTSEKIRLSENDVERSCLDLLRLKGYRPQRLQVGRFKTSDGRWINVGEPGIPDYCVPRFYVETKAPGHSLSEIQQVRIMELERSWNVPVAVVDSVEALARWLEEFEQKSR